MNVPADIFVLKGTRYNLLSTKSSLIKSKTIEFYCTTGSSVANYALNTVQLAIAEKDLSTLEDYPTGTIHALIPMVARSTSGASRALMHIDGVTFQAFAQANVQLYCRVRVLYSE